MKRYIKSSTLFPETGGGQDADKRGGRFSFGKKQFVNMPNGGQFYFVTAKPVFDANTGDIEVSANVAITLDEPYTAKNVNYTQPSIKVRFFSYTKDELKHLYETVCAMSREELLEFLIEQTEGYQASKRVNELKTARENINNKSPHHKRLNKLYRKYLDEYEGKIDEEGYWLE